MKKPQKHGYTHHPLYACYYRMRHRCENPSDSSYSRYGGRGIKVCDEWKRDIVSFIEWGIASGYKRGLSIDRIDNDGDYSPDNCRWANCVQQCNNRRTNKQITYNGETHTVAEWSRIVGIGQLTLNNRITTLGWSVEDALFRPLQEVGHGYDYAKTKTIAYKDGKIVGIFDSQKEAADFCGVSKTRVSACVNGKSDKAKGYVFKAEGR